VKLTTLVPRLRMCGAIPTLPNTSSWRAAYLSPGTTLIPNNIIIIIIIIIIL
jgi:hypothetical protein